MLSPGACHPKLQITIKMKKAGALEHGILNLGG